MSKTSRVPEQSPRPGSRAPVGLTGARIVGAAMDVLEDDGLDKLSLRAVAARLGVRVNAVAWHVKDKAGLLAAVGDAMVAGCVPADLPGDPDEQVRALLGSLRATLRSHRDGARLAREGFSLAAPQRLAFAEAFNTALRATGRGPKDAAWTGSTLLHFLLALVAEEQTPSDRAPSIEAAVADPVTHPSLAATLEHLTTDSFHSRFTYGVDLILTGHSRA